MARLLRELDDLDAGRVRRRRRGRPVLRTALVGLLACGIVSVFAVSLLEKQFGVSLTRDGFRRSHPLGTPPVGRTGSGSFRFMAHQPGEPGRPVAYDPCRPIEYQVNASLAPPGGDRIVEDAAAEVGRATGLVFRRLEDTDRLPDAPRARFRVDREPVLVAWTTPDVVPGLAGRVAGLGGSTAVEDSYTGARRYVTGTVSLDAPQLMEVLHRTDGAAQVRAIVMHELGHLVGLDHVADPQELMYRDNVGLLGFGPGDRQGLAALGSGRCFS